ncbi:multidrug resistance secretion protein [Klebsiella pneumoniae]|uniref:Multidrug resistance secretion protein n=1 Tax=Klebsiella pneumoniae TaxID=573 RepID=A0A377U143_KLEPN|nr:multidrug resistance secretion protein [Klebsiella pneumoniae]
MINSKQLQANIDVKKTALAQAQADLNRRIPLGAANLIGREELQHARDTVASAQAELDVANPAVQRQPGDRAGHQAGTAAGGAPGGH